MSLNNVRYLFFLFQPLRITAAPCQTMVRFPSPTSSSSVMSMLKKKKSPDKNLHLENKYSVVSYKTDVHTVFQRVNSVKMQTKLSKHDSVELQTAFKCNRKYVMYEGNYWDHIEELGSFQKWEPFPRSHGNSLKKCNWKNLEKQFSNCICCNTLMWTLKLW